MKSSMINREFIDVYTFIFGPSSVNVRLQTGHLPRTIRINYYSFLTIVLNCI